MSSNNTIFPFTTSIADIDRQIELGRFRDQVIIAEISNIGFYLFGLLIPFGDFAETVISLLIDVWLLLTFKNFFGKYYWLPFIMESLGILDWITLGVVDWIGWIEMIPFWYLCFDDLLHEEENRGRNDTIIARSKETPQAAPPVKDEYTPEPKCPICGAEWNEKTKICEFCGSQLNIKKT